MKTIGLIAWTALAVGACGRANVPEATATDAVADAALLPTDGHDDIHAEDALAADSSTTCVHVPVQPNCHDGFCLIPAGCFIMGSPHDEPMRGRYNEEQHEVTLTHSFVMQRTELTQAEWTSVGFPNRAGTVNREYGDDCVASNCPAAAMTWFEAIAYANERSKREGRQACIELLGCTGAIGTDFDCTGYRQATSSYYECDGYRLPTHAEYQYAVRGGTRTSFYSGPFEPPSDRCVEIEHLNEAAWYCANSKKTSHPVGQKKPNAWGLYDMMGNAEEYLASNPDEFDPNPKAVTDPFHKLDDTGSFGGGGSCFFAWPALMRAANGSGGGHAFGIPREKQLGPSLGIRLVRSLPPAEAKTW